MKKILVIQCVRSKEYYTGDYYSDEPWSPLINRAESFETVEEIEAKLVEKNQFDDPLFSWVTVEIKTLYIIEDV